MVSGLFINICITFSLTEPDKLKQTPLHASHSWLHMLRIRRGRKSCINIIKRKEETDVLWATDCSPAWMHKYRQTQITHPFVYVRPKSLPEQFVELLFFFKKKMV